MLRLGIYLVNDIISLAGPIEHTSFHGTRVRTGRPTPDNALLSMTCASGCVVSRRRIRQPFIPMAAA